MTNNKFNIFSSILNRNMEVITYGYYGPVMIMFPAMSDSAEIYEEQGTIDALSDLIERGKCRIVCVQSLNNEILFENVLSNQQKAERFAAYNAFITDELIPKFHKSFGGAVQIMACGASVGAFVAANIYFKRPDCFVGLIALSGFFNIEYMIRDYFDDNCYFNSPKHFLPNLNDNYWLSYLRNSRHIYLFSGEGDNEHPQYTKQLSELLYKKNINHLIEIWDNSFSHNFASWNIMFRHILKDKF